MEVLYQSKLEASVHPRIITDTILLYRIIRTSRAFRVQHPKTTIFRRWWLRAIRKLIGLDFVVLYELFRDTSFPDPRRVCLLARSERLPFLECNVKLCDRRLTARRMDSWLIDSATPTPSGRPSLLNLVLSKNTKHKIPIPVVC